MTLRAHGPQVERADSREASKLFSPLLAVEAAGYRIQRSTEPQGQVPGMPTP